MRALILGMGSPILSDDGVGLLVAKKLEGRVRGVDVLTTIMAGVNLLELIAGYNVLFLVDALLSPESHPGELKKMAAGQGTLHLFSSHGFDFFELLTLGETLGYKMPGAVHIYGITIKDRLSFGEGLSPDLEKKAEALSEEILADIQNTLEKPFDDEGLTNGIPFP
jgi:hydrogenase maturation protease